MELIISETPTKFYDVNGCDLVSDPQHNIVQILTFSASLYYTTTLDGGLSGDKFYENEIEKIRIPTVDPIMVSAMDPDAYTDSGAIYLMDSVRNLRRFPPRSTILLRMVLASNPKCHVDMAIYLRALGYSIQPENLDAETAWLLTLPGFKEGELDIQDYVGSQAISYLSYTEEED